MGHLRRSDLVQAYTRIKRDAAGKTCSILILVAPTVDALCALKILTELLKCDFIPFKVIPVAGYDDLNEANDNFIQGRNEIKSVILIDCGATVDLAEMLSLTPEMIIYLVDSHRPYSLVNIFSNSQLMIFDDGFIEENMGDLELAFEATKIDDPAEDTAGDDSSDGDDADQGGGENDDVSNANEDNAARTDAPSAKARGRAEREQRRLRREVCRQKYLDYYGDGAWYGTSVSRLIFDLSDALSRHCNDFLWCSILGVTAQQVMELSGNAAYEVEISWLRERCLQLNRETTLEVGEPAQQQPPTFVNRDGRIKYEPEFRFMLTRHWTLFNSMLHSRYMATRLGVWRDKGRRMLETFIVKMGVPLAQCKLDFQSMELGLKETLPARISKYAGEFGLDDVSFPSFVRDFGFVLRLSASDAVYALMALLEAPHAVGEGSGAVSAAAPPTPVAAEATPVWIKNFYCAFDALEYQNIEYLRSGISLAMKQQQVILMEATTILSHRLLRYGRRFRYVILRSGSDVAWLAGHAFSLSKLALFIADATRSSRRGETPLLVGAYHSGQGTYLVVATGANDGEGARNRFGVAFRRAAQAVRARVKHDGFDTSMIEVKADDLKAFLQTLQTISLI